MPTMNLSDDEVKRVKAMRERGQVEGSLTDAERAAVEGARNRRYNLEDLDSENFVKLSAAEQAAVKRQVMDTAAAAMRGE
jgi:hypothetical protein